MEEKMIIFLLNNFYFLFIFLFFWNNIFVILIFLIKNRYFYFLSVIFCSTFLKSMKCCFCGTVRNCAPYLEKNLQNIEIISQLFEDYEIIIVYDKSDDNSLEILKQYQEKNNKLKLYEKF